MTKRAANQANATKSTGPKTPEGKAKSARNATTHGLFSATPIVREADRPIYDEIAATLRADLHPKGALQESIFANILANSWNLRRVRNLLASLGDGTTDPLANPDLDAQVDRLTRYEQRFERAQYRALAEFRRIQTQTAAIEIAVNDDDIPNWSPLIDVNRVLAAKRARKDADHAPCHADIARYLSDGFVLPAAANTPEAA